MKKTPSGATVRHHYFPFLAVSHTIPAAGAANQAAGPAPRKVKPREKLKDDDDDDADDEDIEVFTCAGTPFLSFVNSPRTDQPHTGSTTPSNAFLASRRGQDTAMADTNKGTFSLI